jgi:hypothetical protein
VKTNRFTTFSFKIWGAIWCLGLLLLGELFFRQVELNTLSLSQLQQRAKVARSNESNSYDYLIIGDSVFFWGISPEVIEADTGLRGYNFATYGQDTLLMPYCIVKHYLRQAKVKPKLIVIGFTPSTFNQERISFDHLFEYDRRCRDEFLRYHNHFDLLIAESSTLEAVPYLLPLVRSGVNEWRSTDDALMIMEALHQDGGFYLPYPDKVWDPAKRPREIKGYPEFGLTNFSKRYFELLLNEISATNIPVLYVIPPSPEPISSEYISFIRSVLSRHPKMRMVDSQPLIYRSELYTDGWHLNRSGAKILSNFVAQQIVEKLLTDTKD